MQCAKCKLIYTYHNLHEFTIFAIADGGHFILSKMIEHISVRAIEKVKDKMPKLIYSCPTGAAGPSGLLLLCFDNDENYVVNMNYLVHLEYKKMIEELILSIPEISPFAHLEITKKFYRNRAHNYYDLIYLGLGNEAYLDNKTMNELESFVGIKVENNISIDVFSKFIADKLSIDLNELYDKFITDPLK